MASGETIYSLEFKGDTELLTEKLPDHFKVTHSRPGGEGYTGLELACSDPADHSEELFDLTVSVGGKLRQLSRKEATLEDVFLELVGAACLIRIVRTQDERAAVVAGEQIVVEGGSRAADAAEKLAGQGKQVYLVTENAEFAAWMEPCHKDVMLKRFAGSNGEGLKSKTFDQPVTVITSSTIVEIRPDGEVTLMDAAFRKSTLRVDNVVLANVEPDDGLYEPLLEAGVTAIKIGDVKQIRNLRAAVTEGANAGLTLDQGLRLNANRAMISRLPTEVQLDNRGE